MGILGKFIPGFCNNCGHQDNRAKYNCNCAEVGCQCNTVACRKAGFWG